jgi:hypothetical protein
VEYAVGLVRAMEALVPTAPLAGQLAELGQVLLDPPSAMGWEGGAYWLNRFTLTGRANLAMALVSGQGPYAGRLDAAAVARKHGHTDLQAAGRFLLDLLVQSDVADSLRRGLLEALPADGRSDDTANDPIRGCAYAIVTLPEYQLA